MNTKIIITLSLMTLTSCVNSNSTYFYKMNLTSPKIVEKKELKTGVLVISLDQIQYNKTKFALKSINLSPLNFKKITIEVLEPETNRIMLKSFDYGVPFVDSAINFNVTLGKNRIVSFNFLDQNDNLISSIMGVTDVLEGKFNRVNLSYFDTCIGQIIKNILKINPDLAKSLNLDTLKANVIALTGYDETLKTFTKKDPLTLNTIKIADFMSANNGIFPSETETNLFGLASINLTLNEIGTRVTLSDLNSNFISGTNSNNINIGSISPGTWNLIVSKSGFKTISQEIKLQSNQTLPLNLTLVKDSDVLLEGIVVGSLSAIDTDISETSVEQAIFNGK